MELLENQKIMKIESHKEDLNQLNIKSWASEMPRYPRPGPKDPTPEKLIQFETLPWTYLWPQPKTKPFIVFVWYQYDGRNIDKEQLAEVPSKT